MKKEDSGRMKIYDDPGIGPVVLRKSMRSRRISIRVHPLRGVAVSIPFCLPYAAGIRFFMQKRDWVAEVMRRQRQRLSSAEKTGTVLGTITDGTKVRTLISEIVFSSAPAHAFHRGQACGRKTVRVGGETDNAVILKTDIVDDVRLTGRLFLSLDRPISMKTVSFPADMPSDALVGVLVKILRDEAKSLLPQKLAFFAQRYGFIYNKVTVKHNSSNWGSCSTKGNINLNLNLVRLPEPVCDYVILHELCHLRYPDHGQDFHVLLERLCADNIARLSDLVSDTANHDVLPSGTGHSETMLPGKVLESGAADRFFSDMIAAIRRSRARFPVHHVLEQEVKKYRLL